MLKWAEFRSRLPRVAAKHLAVDIVIMVISLFGAIYLRVGPTQFEYYAETLGPYFFGIVAIKLATMIAFRCYAVMWRYISSIDAVRLAEAILLSTALSLAVSFFIRGNLFLMPRSIFIIDALLALVGLLGARMARRLLHEGFNHPSKDSSGKRTLIYGAGQNGRHLAQRMRLDSTLMTRLVGFIDDDPAKQKLIIHGLPILGTSSQLEQIISEKRISQVIVAIPHISGDALRHLILATKKFNIRPRIISKVADPSARSATKVEVIREINLADLLNHPPREIDLKSVRELIHGKCVLVTGAGGSIGSEITRQALQHEPGQLLLLDHSEFNLYEIDSELRIPTSDHQRVVPLMVDIKNSSQIDRVVRQYSPDVIFHAAAYKHVHLVEANVESAILNNIGGTLNLLKAAKAVGVRHFVNISTDKAVNPAGVMGATKRVCELLVTIFSQENGSARYCSVRFGNVLGSSGSLIPLLKEQIRNGGPITLTHPDMTRFFMLIPEAVALVNKASTISKPGDISILKMGDPIPIVEIAKSLLALMGKSEDDVPIVFTGARPGEKMFEELYIRGDELETEHPDILTLPNGDIPDFAKQAGTIRNVIDAAEELIKLASNGSPDSRALLNKIVKSFQINEQIVTAEESWAPAAKPNQTH
jgi:FlaA1/EpsC-like NDP-sugar epimerase